MEEVYSCCGCDMDGRGGRLNSVETFTVFLLLMFFSSLAPSHRLLICIFVVLVKIIRGGLVILDNKTSSSLSAGRQYSLNHLNGLGDYSILKSCLKC